MITFRVSIEYPRHLKSRAQLVYDLLVGVGLAGWVWTAVLLAYHW